MARTLKEKLKTLAPARRKRIESEGQRLHAKYLTLKELRKATTLQKRAGRLNPAVEWSVAAILITILVLTYIKPLV